MWIIAHFLVLPSTCALLPSPPQCAPHFTFPEKLGNLSKSARYSYLSGGHTRQTDRWTEEGERGHGAGGEVETFKFTFAKSFSGTVRASCHALTPIHIHLKNPHTHTRSLACSSFLLKVSRPRCSPTTYSAYCMGGEGREGAGGCGFAKGLWADDGGLFRAASLNRASKNLYVLCSYMCYKFLSAPPAATFPFP